MTRLDHDPTIRHKAHDDLEFLASSWTRFDVLQALRDGPRMRHELKDLTQVSRVTLSRILSDLEERGWIRRDGDHYEATDHGRLIADEVGRLLSTLVTADEMADAIEWLPVDEFDFELDRLRDVTVITPDQHDFTAPTSDLVMVVEEHDHIRAVPTGITPAFIEAVRDATTRDELTVELVLPAAVHDIITDDPELAGWFADIASSGNAELYRYDGDRDCLMVGVFGETAMLCGEHDDDGVPPGTVATEDPAIRSWVERYIDVRLNEAERLKVSAFAR